MQQYVGLDVSLEETSICVMDRDGHILQRGVTASEPELIAAYVRRHAPEVTRIVLETGQLSIWLTRALVAQGLPAVCIDARLAHKALSGRRNKSDRHDAEGLAHLARTGWFTEVQVNSRESDERRTLLGARDRLSDHRQGRNRLPCWFFVDHAGVIALDVRNDQAGLGPDRDSFTMDLRLSRESRSFRC